MYKIIVLHGSKGSGKNTIAKMIKEKNPDFEIVAFADPIKQKIQEIFKLKNEEEYDEFKRKTFAELNVTGRDIVRGIGMLMREYNENQFINYVKSKLEKSKNLIITDLRFLNEMNFIKNLKYPNPSNVTLIKVKGGEKDNHISEQEFNDIHFEYIIKNDETLEELKNKVHKIGVENGFL